MYQDFIEINIIPPILQYISQNMVDDTSSIYLIVRHQSAFPGQKTEIGFILQYVYDSDINH